MSKYNRADILERILETTEAGTPESKIRSNTFLTHTEVGMYLDKLINSGLLRYDRQTRTYETTNDGKDFLRTLKQIVYFFNRIEE